ncbi:MAG: GerMN domain-containing protein, partial [Clostridiales bacterium]|nr:GerMN domain-containing protein [Clostridiales bacterium]
MRTSLCAVIMFLCSSFAVVQDAGQVFYIYEIEAEAGERGGAYIWNRREISLEGSTHAENARRLFECFFETAAYCVPSDVRVLSAEMDGDCLVLNVSEDILCYGGNAYETALIAQCEKNAAALPGVEYFTLLIEGELQSLAEGRTVERRPVENS